MIPTFRHTPKPLLSLLLLAAALTAMPGCAEAPDAEPALDTARASRDRAAIIAHRGYSGRAPEHTFAAYRLAAEAGADYIEQDLQFTADSVLVVLHDGTLDRTANGPAALCVGEVRVHTLDELRECEVGSWFNRENPQHADSAFAAERIPTLEEVLGRYGSTHRLYIETKDPDAAPGMEEALVELVHRYPHLVDPAEPPNLYIQSFSLASLQRLHALDPDIPLVLLFGRLSSEEIQDSLPSIAPYASGIGPHFSSVDPALIAAAHQAGMVVHPYTVNTQEEMDRLISIGVDGMFTNEVELGLRRAEAGAQDP